MKELTDLMNLFFYFISGMIFLSLVLYFSCFYYNYSRTNYKQKSGCGFWKVVFDTGARGEYLTYRVFEEEQYPYLLCNLYLPSVNKKLETTELDLTAITPFGIIVVESKNYSGWIYGKESDRNWTQVIYHKKTRFYNPIKQNSNHIKALIKILGNEFEYSVFSYIVFSKRCMLKSVSYDSLNVRVIQRPLLKRLLKQDLECGPRVFTDEQMQEIFNKLLEFSNASEDKKQKHIDNIKNM